MGTGEKEKLAARQKIRPREFVIARGSVRKNDDWRHLSGRFNIQNRQLYYKVRPEFCRVLAARSFIRSSGSVGERVLAPLGFVHDMGTAGFTAVHVSPRQNGQMPTLLS